MKIGSQQQRHSSFVLKYWHTELTGILGEVFRETKWQLPPFQCQDSCYGVGMVIYKSRERGREDVSINTGNIKALALSGDNSDQIHFVQ